jgi:hypothetical protein
MKPSKWDFAQAADARRWCTNPSDVFCLENGALELSPRWWMKLRIKQRRVWRKALRNKGYGRGFYIQPSILRDILRALRAM